MDEIIKARQAVKYIDLPNGQNDLAIIIGSLFAMKGEVLDKGNITAMSGAISRIISERFAGITIDEVRIALTNGIIGDYGEYYGITVISLANFLKAYMHSEARFKAVVVAPVSKQLSAPGNDYNDEKMKSMFDEVKRYFFEKNDIHPTTPCSVILSYLVAIGRISTETLFRYENEAEKRLKNDSTSQKRTMLTMPTARAALIRVEASRQLLTDYLKHLKTKETKK